MTFRKGRSKYRLDIHGQESHAGSAFHEGHSAILELARVIGKLEQVTDRDRGTTLNVGRVRGGTEPNVVAGHAACDIDLRFAENPVAGEVETMLKALQPEDPGVRFALSGEMEKPCMQRTPQIVEMFERARAINAQIDTPLEEMHSGGGSDGNFTAAAGVPTLDGLGVIGNAWHSPNEYLVISALARREFLLRGLIRSLAAEAPAG
ncbi:M20/M25/M40 family metallo-hydrolase [Pseudooceanicola marinus]|uniref:M20/M25/M40 family metallo-hydrolase n=1 Tax=Pseudooceanicola marinus TaxID=396013 RepID=UPI001CD39F0C|nr:M20/M25/M40 family metallo-hydrolase [Pseudooceanicola marinus]MCA1334542.1 M20/M25/M40 family metallo-hydrolase [Pseudooceanicola marinus]